MLPHRQETEKPFAANAIAHARAGRGHPLVLNGTLSLNSVPVGACSLGPSAGKWHGGGQRHASRIIAPTRTNCRAIPASKRVTSWHARPIATSTRAVMRGSLARLLLVPFPLVKRVPVTALPCVKLCASLILRCRGRYRYDRPRQKLVRARPCALPRADFGLRHDIHKLPTRATPAGPFGRVPHSVLHFRYRQSKQKKYRNFAYIRDAQQRVVVLNTASPPVANSF